MPRPNRWNAIVQAAAEEFRERGFEAATLESIAARVGLTKGSLYHYIDTKDDLLFAVIELPANRLLERVEELVVRDAPASSRLRELIHLQVDIFRRSYPAAFVYLQNLARPDHPEAFRDRDHRYVVAIARIIEDGVARGEFALSAPPRLVAYGLLGALGWMQHWYEPEHGLPPDVIADHLFAVTVGGLVAGGQLAALLEGQPPLRIAPAYADETELAT
ncbi:TetR/AcrR family transcriptional regulator [Nitriliruptoraceae bacterium ZYF776]|nr:TetR/AcrR family transcriptional regulator [Profundirhabdus halotolerans]